MDSTFTERWIRKFRVMTLSLIFSGALNIGLIAAFVAALMQERENAFSVKFPQAKEKIEEATNLSLLNKYSHLSFRELSALLTNTDLVEEGFSKRDLALSALVSFHDFNLEKAIGAAPAQSRTVQFDDRTVQLLPNLGDDQFQAIIHYAYLEQWPLTSHGLFKVLIKSAKPRDASLVQAFILTPEFDALQTLFQKTESGVSSEKMIDLICEGNWELLDGFVREQSQMLDISVERRRRLLLSFFATQSATAADLLLQTDLVFAVKRLDNQGVVDLLSRAEKNENLQKFCIALLQSARGDMIYEKSAECLYQMANEEKPQPFDLAKAKERFLPKAALPKMASIVKEKAAPVAQSNPKKEMTAVRKNREVVLRTHEVSAGESLWKIARQYHVKVDDLAAINHLEKDRLKPGMVLKIPQGTGSKPPR